MRSFVLGGLAIALLLYGCSPAPPPTDYTESVLMKSELSGQSAVRAVETSGDADDYTFSVIVESGDTGCGQYADWWEVITPGGELLYRRILAHSHVDEQPFARSGGPVAVGENDVVLVRSHANPGGYSTQAIAGSVSQGFQPTVLSEDFAIDLAEAQPQPSGCAF